MDWTPLFFAKRWVFLARMKILDFYAAWVGWVLLINEKSGGCGDSKTETWLTRWKISTLSMRKNGYPKESTRHWGPRKKALKIFQAIDKGRPTLAARSKHEKTRTDKKQHGINGYFASTINHNYEICRSNYTRNVGYGYPKKDFFRKFNVPPLV